MKNKIINNICINVIISTIIFNFCGCSLEQNSNVVEEELLIDLCKNALEAMGERNTDDTLRYTNLKEMYCSTNNRFLDDADVYDRIDTLMKDPLSMLGVVDQYGKMENVIFHDVAQVSAKEIKEYNDYMDDPATWNNKEQTFDYNIESAYEIKIEYDLYGQHVDDCVVVVYSDEQWKFDLFVDLSKDLQVIIDSMEK